MDSCNKQTRGEPIAGLFDALRKRSDNPGLFTGHNHIVITQVDMGRATGELVARESSLNVLGTVHGGALMTLADTVCGTACATHGMRCTTLNCDMSFLRPSFSGDKLTCTAETVKAGRTIIVMDAAIANEAGDLLATGRFTFFVTGPLTREHLVL